MFKIKVKEVHRVRSKMERISLSYFTANESNYVASDFTLWLKSDVRSASRTRILHSMGKVDNMDKMAV